MNAKKITAHRNPTKAEIRFGHGCFHYREFPIDLWLKPDGQLKKWISFRGLRYYRG